MGVVWLLSNLCTLPMFHVSVNASNLLLSIYLPAHTLDAHLATILSAHPDANTMRMTLIATPTLTHALVGLALRDM